MSVAFQDSILDDSTDFDLELDETIRLECLKGFDAIRTEMDSLLFTELLAVSLASVTYVPQRISNESKVGIQTRE